jgi:hypothetical protein
MREMPTTKTLENFGASKSSVTSSGRAAFDITLSSVANGNATCLSPKDFETNRGDVTSARLSFSTA